jgi:hypothetical protein
MMVLTIRCELVMIYVDTNLRETFTIMVPSTLSCFLLASVQQSGLSLKRRRKKKDWN